MAKSLVVKLTEQKKQVKENKAAVLTVDVDLEATGKGTSRAQSSAQEAVIKVFVRSKSDPSPRLVGTITSTIGVTANVPSFDMNAALLHREIVAADTDNFTELTFNPRTFRHPKDKPVTMTLRLPDAPPGLVLQGDGRGKNVQVSDFELGAELSIGGTVETAAFGDVAHVPLRHEPVQDDSVTTLKDVCVGATTVYPVSLMVQDRTYPPPRTLKLPIGADKFEILLHPRVKATLDRNSAFAASKLIANLQAIFAPVFGTISAEILTEGDKRLDEWKQTGTEVHSKTMKDAKRAQPEEGHLVPFFQFWISTAKPEDLPSPPDEPDALGVAETLAAPAHYFNADTRQKRIQQPAHLLIPAFADMYRQAKGDEANVFAANVIAHEVGHGLGLLHIKRADKDYAVEGGVGLMANQFKPTDGVPILLKRLRAVHEAVLKHHYK
jgi:hypothetical protein